MALTTIILANCLDNLVIIDNVLYPNYSNSLTKELSESI